MGRWSGAETFQAGRDRSRERFGRVPRAIDLNDPKLKRVRSGSEGATYLAPSCFVGEFWPAAHIKVLKAEQALQRMAKREQLLEDDRAFGEYLPNWAELVAIDGQTDVLGVATVLLGYRDDMQTIDSDSDFRQVPPLFKEAAQWLRRYKNEMRFSEYGILMYQNFEEEVSRLLQLLKYHHWQADPDVFGISVEKRSLPDWPYWRHIYMLDLGRGLKKLPANQQPQNATGRVWDMVEMTY